MTDSPHDRFFHDLSPLEGCGGDIESERICEGGVVN